MEIELLEKSDLWLRNDSFKFFAHGVQLGLL